MAANEEQKDNDENVGGAKFGKVSAKRISSALSIMVPLMMKMVGEFIPRLTPPPPSARHTLIREVCITLHPEL